MTASPLRRHRTLIRLAYLGGGVGLVYAGITLAGGVSDAADQIRHLSPWWIVPGAAWWHSVSPRSRD